MNLFLFAGAGTSAELGVPVMRQMALDLLVHMGANADADVFFTALRKRVDEETADLESVIEDIDKICDAESVMPAFGQSIDPQLVESARIARAEIEWFVQHTCERVRQSAAAALWGPLIQIGGDIHLTVATTNYDRAVELASQRLNISVVDGFSGFDDKEWASWIGYEATGTRLLKLHGSTDWYQVSDTLSVVKLRHPMPLFGGVTLHVDSAGFGALGSALVLPSREKRKNVPPFPQISHELFAAAKSSDVAVFVGTSLRDPDVRSLAEECSVRVPTIVVGPDMQFGSGTAPGRSSIIRDYASGFLISTLPHMISSSSWPEPGSETDAEGVAAVKSILEEIVTLANPAASDDARCLAVESLWNMRVSLGAKDITQLIERGSGRVARDALALIPFSRDAVQTMADAERIAQATSDPGFRADVELLREGFQTIASERSASTAAP